LQILLLPGKISMLAFPKDLSLVLFFSLSLYDIVKDINSDIGLFADDTSLYIIVDSPDTSAHLLNSDLNRIHLWSKT